MDAVVNGTRLFYNRIGRGQPMLMMHGGLGMDHTLLRSHDPLADRVELVYYDHRSHGRSDRASPASFRLSDLHDDAASLLTQLECPRAVIYGHSYGAWLALGFALRYPDRTAALVLCGGAAVFDYAEVALANAQRRNPGLTAELIEALSTPPATDAAYRDMFSRIQPLYFHRFEERYRTAFADIQFSTSAYAVGAAQLATLNMIDQVESLRCPVLLIVGDDDFITPAAQSYRIAERAADAEVVEVASCGHFPFLERPTEYMSALRGWIDRRLSTSGR
jgi:proline iminopeptidase